jgi:hypothetical protein
MRKVPTAPLQACSYGPCLRLAVLKASLLCAWRQKPHNTLAGRDLTSGQVSSTSTIFAERVMYDWLVKAYFAARATGVRRSCTRDVISILIFRQVALRFRMSNPLKLSIINGYAVEYAVTIGLSSEINLLSHLVTCSHPWQFRVVSFLAP